MGKIIISILVRRVRTKLTLVIPPKCKLLDATEPLLALILPLYVEPIP